MQCVGVRKASFCRDVDGKFVETVLEKPVAVEYSTEKMAEPIFGDEHSITVLRRRHSYRMLTKTEVMKEAFGFDKSERGLLHIVVQAL